MWILDFFKKFNKKKKKYMISPDKIETLKDKLSSYSKYQWIKSERAGAVTEFLNLAIEHDGTLMVEFTDGSRVKYELLNEFLIKTNNENELLEIDQVGVPKQETFGTKNGAPSASVRPNVTVKPIVDSNPIHTLLKKQKPNPVNIDITMELNIPSADLYNVIRQSFDNAEDEVVNYIVSGLDINVIKESVKKAIIDFYSSDK